MTTYRVFGEAHGNMFDEGGFPTSQAAEAYASSIIDGDFDSTVQVVSEVSDDLPDDTDFDYDDRPWGEQQEQIDWMESRYDDYPPGFDDEYDAWDER